MREHPYSTMSLHGSCTIASLGEGAGVCSRREEPSVSPSNGPSLMGEVTVEDAVQPLW